MVKEDKESIIFSKLKIFRLKNVQFKSLLLVLHT